MPAWDPRQGMQQTSPQVASHTRARQGHNAQNIAKIPDSALRADNTSKSIARDTRGPAQTCAYITASDAAHMHRAQSARLGSPSPSPFTRADNASTKHGTTHACGRGTRARLGTRPFDPLRPWRRQLRAPSSSSNLSWLSHRVAPTGLRQTRDGRESGRWRIECRRDLLARRFERCSRFERAGPGRGRLGRAAGSLGSAMVVQSSSPR